jgi:hypothetical protein
MWSTTNIDNNWWDTTNTNIARQWPCASWYHIPTTWEFTSLITIWWWTMGWGGDMMKKLKIPLVWYRNRYTNGYSYEWANWRYWTSSNNNATNAYNYSIYYYSSNNSWVIWWDMNEKALWLPIRCFKN